MTERQDVEEVIERARVAVEREALWKRLIQAEEEERRRLSRDLHDAAGQHLAALALGLKSLANLAPPHSEMYTHAVQLSRLSDTLSQDLHALAVRLRPKVLDDFGLEPALLAYAQEWSRQQGIEIVVHAHAEAERLPVFVEGAIYRVVQEALTNVGRHSGATRASVVVERRKGQIVAVVTDDGSGFDPGASHVSDELSSRLGLQGMRERVALLDGTVEIESDDRGTTLFVRIPIITEPDRS